MKKLLLSVLILLSPLASVHADKGDFSPAISGITGAKPSDVSGPRSHPHGLNEASFNRFTDSYGWAYYLWRADCDKDANGRFVNCRNVDTNYLDERDFVAGRKDDGTSNLYYHSVPGALALNDTVLMPVIIHNSARQDQFPANNTVLTIDWSNPDAVKAILTSSTANPSPFTDIVNFDMPEGLTFAHNGAKYGNNKIRIKKGGNNDVNVTSLDQTSLTYNFGQILGSYANARIVYIPLKVVEATANIQIDKTDENPQDFDATQANDSQLVGAGTTAVFRITVTNNGSESLESVIVSDDEAPNCAKTATETQALYPGTTFDVGESFTYTCDKANANDGDFDGVNAQGSVDKHNDARVEAKSTVNNVAVSDQDASEVLFMAQCTPTAGVINIVKDDSTPGQPDTDGNDTQQITNGGTANFTIMVSNPGTSVISDVSVSDSLSPTCARTRAEFITLLGAQGNNDDKLDPGEVVTYTCTQTNVTTSFTNSATVSGQVKTVPCAVTKTDTTEVVVTGGPGGFCGDGVVDPGEQCDNGPSNGLNGNICRTDCTTGGGGGTGIPTPTVGSCAFNESTGAALCTGKKPVEDVSDVYWQKYRKCYYGEPGGYDVTGIVAPTLEKACAMRWAEDKGLTLCGAVIGGYIDPFQSPTASEILNQCDPTQPPIACTPVNTPCPECFKAGNSIVKQVRPADLSSPLSTTTTVAKGENAKYQVTLNISDFDYSTHQILDAKVRVYDQTIPTESGNIFNRQGIVDGDGNNTWKWCDENALCPEFGEYFYQVLDGATIAEINATGGTALEVHYDMDTDVASAKDTANIKNVAYAMIYYTYSVTDPVTGAITTGNTIAGFGDNICQPAPPTKISQLAQGTFGSVANVNVIRPFVQAKAGNAGYFSTDTDKAFADQQAIYDNTGLLTPTVLNQGVTITGNTNFDVYEGAPVGNAQDFGSFQTDKVDFYANVDAATGTTDQPVPGTALSFKQVGSANVFQVTGNLNVAELEGLTESATFIVSNGDVIVRDTDHKIEFGNEVFPAFIVRDGDLLIDKAVTAMQGLYLVEQGEIKSADDAVSTTPLKVSGNLYGNLGHLLSYRRYIGTGSTIEPSIEINFDVRLLENTPPMLQQFLGDGWREAVQQ